MAPTSLRERMRQALRIRNMSPRTERIYIDLVAGFALHFHRSPDRLGLPEIEQYLFFLRDTRKVSYCWFNQCVCSPLLLSLHDGSSRPGHAHPVWPAGAASSSRSFRRRTGRASGSHRLSA